MGIASIPAMPASVVTAGLCVYHFKLLILYLLLDELLKGVYKICGLLGSSYIFFQSSTFM